MTGLDNPDLIRALKVQARGCEAVGAPFYHDLLRQAAADLEAGGPVCELLAPWADADVRRILEDAAPIRLLGALHDLGLSGDDPALAAAFPHPERPGDPVAAWACAVRAIERDGQRLAAFMAHEPQTNEVRRAAALIGGFLTVAQETRLPLRTFELGASAGLNLNWDRFRYQLGPHRWGDPTSSVLIDADWEGPAPPLDAPVEILTRRACDRRPVDLDADARRLIAYVWPEQFDRVGRAHAAIALARAIGVTVEAADAVDWTRRVAAPQASSATVVYHSVFWQYLPAAGQAALREAIEAQGRAATTDAPFAWLRMEPGGDDITEMDLRLTLWPGGEERRLARAHPHGAWVKWES